MTGAPTAGQTAARGGLRRRALGLLASVAVVLGATLTLGVSAAVAAVPPAAGSVTTAAAGRVTTAAAGSVTTAAAGDATLSTTGEAAIDDVRTCIASNTQLNVFYLIDASGSLFKDVDPVNATDPDFVRADIIGNSLKQLAGLGNGVQVNYSAGFFGSTYKQAVGWSPVNTDTAAASADALNQSIRAQPSLGFTDWGLGIAGAQSALAAERGSNGGCQMLVWLTDGALNIHDDSAQNAAAINTLCGNTIDGTSQPAAGLGTFNALRQSGVVVVGVLLSVNPDPAESTQTQYMRPLVESTGEVNGSTVTCGQSPPPSSSVNGALVEARDPNQLALVFAKLSVLLNGGYPHPFDADGGFEVDPGIANFTVLTSDPNWVLTPPAGSGLAAVSSAVADPNVSVTSTGGAIQVDVDVASAAYQGRWMLSTPSDTNPSLYYYSGLTITPAASNRLIAGLGATLSGAIATTTGRPLALENYSYALQVSKLPADGSAAQPIGTATVAADGSFTAPYTPGADDGGAVSLVYSLDPLTTSKNSLALAAVSASQQIAVTVPANYPSVAPSAVALTTIDGAKGSATGSLALTAPADGSAGSVCFPNGTTPVVTSDPANRAGSWNWISSAAVDAQGCVALAPGQTVTVDLTASNSVAANSSVVATVPVALTSAAGESLPQTVTVSFDTTRPVNAAAFNIAVLVLIALGLLIALFVLWLMNRLASGIAHGRQLLRASFPVTVDAENGVVGASTFSGSPAVHLASAGLDDFRYQRPLATVKSHDDPELGALRTRAGLFQTRYDLTAPSGSRVFTTVAGPAARPGAGGVARRRAIESGRVAPISDQLNRLWAVVIREGDLVAGAPGAPIPARLVVFKRNEPNRSDQFEARMIDITSDTKLWPRISRARTLLLDEGRAGGGSGGATHSGRVPPQRSSGAPAPALPPAARGNTGDQPPPPPPRSGSRTEPPPPRR